MESRPLRPPPLAAHPPAASLAALERGEPLPVLPAVTRAARLAESRSGVRALDI